MEYCASEDWRRLVQDTILPVALRDVSLGDDALEIGPGPGFTTDVLRTMTSHLTAVEVDEGLAAQLARRLGAENVDVVLGDATAARVPRRPLLGGGVLPHAPPHRAVSTARPRLRGTGPRARPGRECWWPRTACTAKGQQRSTRTTPTTRSTPTSWWTGSATPASGTLTCASTSSDGCARHAPPHRAAPEGGIRSQVTAHERS